MSTHTLAYLILGLVVAQRLIELLFANRNTRLLLARGGIEYGRSHYPFIVLLHAGWLIAITVFLPDVPAIHWLWLSLFAGLQGLRIWIWQSLGSYWTTRIITVPDAPLVRTGPYRYMRHPNYAVVIGEIASLPLAFGEPAVAVTFTAMNLMLLYWRVRIENRVLDARRALGGS